MTRKEEIEKAMKESVTESLMCCDRIGSFTPKATDMLECAWIKGAQWADKTMIDKACEWLQKRCDTTLLEPMTTFIEDFRKAMEQ